MAIICETSRSSHATLKGVIEHPLVAVSWLFLNCAPVSGLGATVIYDMIGLPQETLRYTRADIIYRIFGPWGLKALIQHFAPYIDPAEIKRRRSHQSQEPSSKRLMKEFSQESPRHFLLFPSTTEREIAGYLTNLQSLSVTGKDTVSAQSTNKIQKRAWALSHTANVLLNPKMRVRYRAEWDRARALEIMSHSFETACGRRMHPYISCKEMIFAMEIAEASLAIEEAPEALEAIAGLFSDAASGIARFIDIEMREPQYPGFVPKELKEEIVNAAWGLLSCAKMGSLNEKRSDVSEKIINARTVLAQIYASVGERVYPSFYASLEKAIKIIEMAGDNNIPPYSRAWFKDYFQANQFQPIFTKAITNNGEITLRLDKDLQLRADYPLLVSFAIRYPYNTDIIIIEGDGTAKVINLQQVREYLFEGLTPSDDIIKSLISLVGNSTVHYPLHHLNDEKINN